MEVTHSAQNFLKINCSSVAIGIYLFAPTKQIELTHEFITLPLDKGKETLMLSLSFKHINKVEFLDNSEGEGAGLVLFVNDFMARKIQTYVDQEGAGFIDFRLESYTNNSNDKFIVLEIQNKDAKFFRHLLEILYKADLYHRNYIIQQMNKSKKKHYYIPITFIDVISSSQWKTLNKLLGSARSDFQQRRQLKLVDDNNENGINSARLSVVLSPNVQPSVSVECQHQIHIDEVHQKPTCHLPAYTVMTVPVPTHNQTPAVVSVRALLPSSVVLNVPSQQSPSSPSMDANSKASHNQSSPALLTIPTPRPHCPSSAPSTVPSSQPSPPLSLPQLPMPLLCQEETELILKFEHERKPLHHEQQTQSPQKVTLTSFGEPTVAQFLSLESSTVNKFMPRSLKLSKAQPINDNAQNGKSAPPFLSIQTSPGTSQDLQKQLSPQVQKSKSSTGGTAKTSKREREVHLIDDEENESEAKHTPSEKRTNDTLFSFPPTGRDSCSVHYADLKYLSRNCMLNDTIIDFYLKYIHHCLVPQERRAKIFIFNSFFFGRLTQPPLGGKPSNTVTPATKIRRVTGNFQRVKNWTKKVNLFDMDFIIVPINEDIHWYLAIIVNVRNGICSLNTNEPIFAAPNQSPPLAHLIVLNSLIDPAEDKHLAVRDQLAEYLHLEYADKLCQDTKTFFNKQMMDVVVPTLLPQQKNFIDCGLFLLHFAQLFLSNPPKFISKRSSFRRWYPNFEIKQKRDELRKVIMRLASHVKPSDFVQLPTPKRKSRNVGRRSQVDKTQMILDGMAMMGRTRRYSDSELDGIMKDEHFSCLYRPRSFDSLVYENREKPLVLQPPTIAEMSRFKQPRRVRQEIFASSMRQGPI